MASTAAALPNTSLVRRTVSCFSNCYCIVVVLFFATVACAQEASVCEGNALGSFALRQTLVSGGFFNENGSNTTPSVLQGGFGVSVSIHNNVLAVGVRGVQGVPGHVIVFQDNDDDDDALFVPVSTTTERSSSSSSFADSVALWDHVLVVGTPTAPSGTVASAGTAYVYHSDDSAATEQDNNTSSSSASWRLETQILAPNPTTDQQFGAVVDLYQDTAVIGNAIRGARGQVVIARRVTSNTNNTTNNNATAVWVEQASLTSTEFFLDEFGASVSIHKDRVAVGSPLSNFGFGEIYLYARNNDVWEVSARLVNPAQLSLTNFGGAVSLFDNVLVVGAPEYTIPGGTRSTGWVFVYEYDPDLAQWDPVQTLEPPNPALAGAFGALVVAERNVIVVSDKLYNINDMAHAGGIFVYTRAAAAQQEWILSSTLTSPEPIEGFTFGYDVAMHGALLTIAESREEEQWIGGAVHVYAHCVETTPSAPPTHAPTHMPTMTSLPSSTASHVPSILPSSSPYPSTVPFGDPSTAPVVPTSAASPSQAPTGKAPTTTTPQTTVTTPIETPPPTTMPTMTTSLAFRRMSVTASAVWYTSAAALVWSLW